jgi:hypothetical protein
MNAFLTYITKERHLAPRIVVAVKWIAKVIYNTFMVIFGIIFVLILLCFAAQGIAALMGIFSGCHRKSSKK